MAETEIVIEGYNQIGHLYHKHRDVHKIDAELQQFTNSLPKHAIVLDAGSGGGVPGARYLARRNISVIGIDISPKMVKLARKNVPTAEFFEMDMRYTKFDNNKFDGVMALFSLFNVSRKNHFQVFREFYRVLKPGGKLMINNGIGESEGISRFFGVPMFWSNFSPNKTLEIVKKAGFITDFEGILERGGELQYWIFANKPD